MTKSTYMSEWRRRNPGKMAGYSRRYRRRMSASEKLSALRRKRDAARQRRYRADTRNVNRLQQRMDYRGRPVSVEEARELISEYGPDYPLSRGLTHQQALWARRRSEAGKQGRGPVETWDVIVFEAYEVGK